MAHSLPRKDRAMSERDIRSETKLLKEEWEELMPELRSLQDLLQEQLQDLYDAEHQIVKALPQMAQKASSPQLKQALEQHLQVTQQQVQRLDQVFQQLGQPAKGKTCAAMQGLVKEGEELMKMQAEPAVMDAGLIASAQRIEHYEMAGYGTVRTWAQELGQQQVANLLQQTLNEEEQADQLLTQIAERRVNPQAM